MKKELHDKIRTLASEILSEEEVTPISSLKEKARAIYEHSLILDFLESKTDASNLSVGEESLDSKSFREQNWFKDPVPIPQPENTEELIEPLMEKIKDIVAQMPSDNEHETLKGLQSNTNISKNELDEFAASYKEMPTFERKEPSKGGSVPQTKNELIIDSGASIIKPKSINDSLNIGLVIGLNDRIAFIKHLFEESTEDYSRVISQIASMKTYDEAESFIRNTVQPDYNNWGDKEEYSSRFMTIIEKSFSLQNG